MTDHLASLDDVILGMHGAKLRAAQDRLAALRAEVQKSLATAEFTAGGALVPAQHSRSTVQVTLPVQAAQIIQDWVLTNLNPADVLEMEETPHITVRYGFEATVTPEEVAVVIGYPAPWAPTPFQVLVSGLGVFEGAEDGTRDVLVAWVADDSGTLIGLNEELGDLPNSTTHDTYLPHVTLAYLPVGAGERVLVSLDETPHLLVDVDHVEWRGADGLHASIPLTGQSMPLMDNGGRPVGKAYNEDQPRAPAGSPEGGQWVSEGGEGGGGVESHEGLDATQIAEEDRSTARQAYTTLKAKWSTVNNDLINYMDRPDSKEATQKMQELKSIVKQMTLLDADPGGHEGIGLPGGPRDVVIVGGGPGGLAAAIMGGTEGLDTLMVEANPQAGGQARFSSRIENFPGFPVGAAGSNLAGSMFEQAQRVGAETMLGVRVTGVSHDPSTGLKTVTLSNGKSIQTRAVLVAGGVEFAKATFPGADAPGVSYGDAETLSHDGVGGSVVVLGGSNGAAQAALGAARKATHVTIVARSGLPKSMSDYQVQAVRAHPRISVLEGQDVDRVQVGANGRPEGVLLKSGQLVPAKAVGVFWGNKPNTAWLPKDVTLENGKIKTVAQSFHSSLPGVFAAGDIRQGSIGRIGAAVGEGQFAMREIWDYVHGLHQHPNPGG